MMRVRGSQCSWSLIVWRVHTGYSYRVLSSQRGTEREEISDSTSPPCGLKRDNNLFMVEAKVSINKNVFRGHKSSVTPDNNWQMKLGDYETFVNCDIFLFF